MFYIFTGIPALCGPILLNRYRNFNMSSTSGILLSVSNIKQCFHLHSNIRCDLEIVSRSWSFNSECYQIAVNFISTHFFTLFLSVYGSFGIFLSILFYILKKTMEEYGAYTSFPHDAIDCHRLIVSYIDIYVPALSW